jgi:hypothetical protein
MVFMDTETSAWEQVGTVAVDSGRCLVVDPTYHRDGFYGVAEVEAATMASVGAQTQAAPLVTADGMTIGTVVGAGYGDDEYPVEVRYIMDERGVRRIAELRARFIDD